MRQNSSKASRTNGLSNSPAALAQKIVGAGVALWVGVLAAAFSFASAFDTSQPQMALAAYDNNPDAKMRLADLKIAESTASKIAELRKMPVEKAEDVSTEKLMESLSIDVRAQIYNLAIGVLKRSPYSAGAIRQLAFLEANPNRRKELLTLSQRISRRDVIAAFQLAEMQIQSGSVPSGLAMIDRALTVSQALDATAFPLLLSSARDQEVAHLLRQIFASDPVWGERLAIHAVENATSAQAFVQLANAFPKNSRARSLDYGTQLVDRLANDRNFSAAFEAYDIYSDSPQDFAAFGTGKFPPIDWRLVDNLETGARLLEPDGPIVEIFATAGKRGEVGQILAALPRGQYRLSFDAEEVRGAGGRLSLNLVCLEDGREVGSQENSTTINNGQLAISFTVSAECRVQNLRLSAVSYRVDLSALVTNVQISRVNPSSGTLGATSQNLRPTS